MHSKSRILLEILHKIIKSFNKHEVSDPSDQVRGQRGKWGIGGQILQSLENFLNFL